MKIKTIYIMDDQQCDLQDLQGIIPEAWILPGIGEYIDDEGSVTSLPPFDIPIRVVSVGRFFNGI